MYGKADLLKVVYDNCDHRDSGQQEDSLPFLGKYHELFTGNLGDWKTEPVGLEIKEGANPFHGRPFPVPDIHGDTLEKEVNRLVELGVLKWQGASECASPTFVVPKKKGKVRFI